MEDLGAVYTDKQLRDLERAMSRLYTQAGKDIEKKLQDFTEKAQKKEQVLAKRVKDGSMTQEEFDRWKSGVVFRGKQWNDKMAQVSAVLADTNTVATNILRDRQIGVFSMNGNYAAYQFEHGAGVSFGFDLYDQTTVSRLLRDKPNILPFKKLDKEKDVKWNFKNIRSQITQGILQGESIPKIAERLASVVPNRNQKQMVLHARTAMTAAQNGGRMERYREAEELGIKFKKVWLATLDARTRDTHIELDGQAVKPDEDFEVDGYKIAYPGDPHAAPEMTYNCRCTLVTELEDYPSSFGRREIGTGEIISDIAYNEWRQAREAEKDTGIKTKLPTPKQFKNDFDKAKSTLNPGQEWRVDDTHSIEDYANDKLFELSGGSVVAIESNGNIVSVCKNQKGNDRGSDLLKVAVANGGDRLDAFGNGLYDFYVKNGFEPVSWTPFNEEYAPHDWVKGRDNPEPVIFYRYTGNKTELSYKDFLQSTKPNTGEDGYYDAMIIRDNMLDKK